MDIEIRGMAQLLQVFDMPTSIAFYRDKLGFEVKSTSNTRGQHFDWALLRLNGVELMLNMAYEEDARPPAPDPVRIAAHDDTAIDFGCPDVDAVYACLCARGVAAKEPKMPLRHEAVVPPRPRRIYPVFSVAGCAVNGDLLPLAAPRRR